MSTSIWPAEYLSEPRDIHRKHGNHLVVFLVSPFSPKERYDNLLAFCQAVCAEVGHLVNAEVECVRADSVFTPGVIQGDIWDHIQASDAIIADVSERNGNVMLELGVAATLRSKNHVIVIQDEGAPSGFLFDISPARHLVYGRDLGASLKFRGQLREAPLFALTPAPYVPSRISTSALPLELELTRQADSDHLLGPSNAHRRLADDGLEFGLFYVFRYSWLTLGQQDFDYVDLRSEMRFANVRPQTPTGHGWIGIMLRSQHFFAEFGHLLYVTSDGTVRHTQPLHKTAKLPDDPVLGKIQGFSMGDWVTFELRFDAQALSGSIGGVDFTLKTATMPHVYSSGQIRFQTHLARARIKTIRARDVNPIGDLCITPACS